ncbi:hypothetical protein O6H91_19G074700 [Diphasiastrum complanatum]|uniref:Uncharacterized protein n=1 Tax=Diphasiastrum complanatum TaxID=34168 RepID=A0ACC2AWP5_DIPCM|nr:hypothetical protein O6H91_Y058500 [Diphasiastrum complanatum]KAJ7521921.1 hypothetical protein O6H91_19G074700 [Diphasiastrum complanatum]
MEQLRMASRSSSNALLLTYRLLQVAMILRIASALQPSQPLPAAANFSFPSFFTNANTTSDLLLIGDARIAEQQGGHPEVFLQLSGSMPATAGGLLYRRPIQMFELSSRIPFSFSLSFIFMLSSSSEDYLSFLMLPDNTSSQDLSSCLEGQNKAVFCSSLAIRFRISKTERSYSGSSDGDVIIDVDLGDVITESSCELISDWNDGRRLYTWIDYDSKCKVLDIRMSDADNDSPNTCSIAHNLDLTKIIDSKMYLGFISSSGTANHKNILFSWNFQNGKTTGPSASYRKSTMHSIPVDPSRFEDHNSFRKDGGGPWGSVIVGLLCVASISLLASTVCVIFRRKSVCNDAESDGIARHSVYQKLGAT